MVSAASVGTGALCIEVLHRMNGRSLGGWPINPPALASWQPSSGKLAANLGSDVAGVALSARHVKKTNAHDHAAHGMQRIVSGELRRSFNIVVHGSPHVGA
jgi:hypothetical protein